MKLSLNIGERLVLASVINIFGQGLSLSSMKDCFKILDKIDISEDERKKVNFKTDEKRVRWDDEKYSIDIDFSSDEMKMIKEFIKKKDKENKFSVNEGKIMLTLVDKINGEKEDEK